MSSLRDLQSSLTRRASVKRETTTQQTQDSQSGVVVEHPTARQRPTADFMVLPSDAPQIPVPSYEDTKSAPVLPPTRHFSGGVPGIGVMFGEADVQCEIFKPNTTEDVKQLDFAGDIPYLLEYVKNLESVLGATVPLSVYGLTSSMWAGNPEYEVVNFNGVDYLSCKIRSTSEEELSRLCTRVFSEVKVNSSYSVSMFKPHLCVLNGVTKYVVALLVNTYEFNALKAMVRQHLEGFQCDVVSAGGDIILTVRKSDFGLR